MVLNKRQRSLSTIYMKKLLLMIIILFISKVYAMERNITIELKNIFSGEGKVYIAIYNSEYNYKNDIQLKSYIMDSTDTVLEIKDKLPEGYYVISVFQDLNNNGKLDFNLLGIPREPIGLSNYNGMGIPGGYEKLKVKVLEENQKITIKMIKTI